MPAKDTRGVTKAWAPVHIDSDLYEQLRELAAADDRTITRYVNRALKLHIEKQRGRPS